INRPNTWMHPTIIITAEKLLRRGGRPHMDLQWPHLGTIRLAEAVHDITSVEREGLTRHAAAARFGVAPSSAIKWVQRFRATGSVAPGQIGGHKPKTLRGEHRDWLLERMTRDFTLRGLVAELAEQRGLKVDYRSVWEFVHAEGLSFKKS